MGKLPVINEQQLIVLKEALNFLHVEELRGICVQLSLPTKGKKVPLITRIMHFLATDEIVIEPQMPRVSRAQRGHAYPLSPETPMLKGAYKNDLQTRLFFKQLIGEYFHFTAFGIDWLNERWMSGNPPTYQEFATMWQAEYARRKIHASQPKEEWAYINFTQNFVQENPDATREMINAAWEKEHTRNKKIVATILSTIS